MILTILANQVSILTECEYLTVEFRVPHMLLVLGQPMAKACLRLHHALRRIRPTVVGLAGCDEHLNRVRFIFAALPFTLVFSLLVGLVPVTYANVPEPRPTESARSKLAVQYSDQAIGQRMKGHFPEALRLISKSIEMYPKDCEFLFIRSQIYGNQKRYREAITDLNGALRDRQPNCPVSVELQSRAYYFLKVGELAKCAKDLSAAKKLAPNDPDIRLLQARLYRSQHRWAAAKAEYRETLNLLRQEGGCRLPPPPVAAADFIIVDMESLVNKELTEVERLSRRMTK